MSQTTSSARVPTWVIDPNGRVENFLRLAPGTALNLPPGYTTTTERPVPAQRPLPASIPRWAARATLEVVGKLTQVDNLMRNQMGIDWKWRWAEAETFMVEDLLAIAQARLGMSPAEAEGMIRDAMARAGL